MIWLIYLFFLVFYYLGFRHGRMKEKFENEQW